jgi:hypothetical protein
MFPRGKGGQYVGLATLRPSYADCLEIWEPKPPGTLSRSVTLLLYRTKLYSDTIISNVILVITKYVQQ